MGGDALSTTPISDRRRVWDCIRPSLRTDIVGPPVPNFILRDHVYDLWSILSSVSLQKPDNDGVAKEQFLLDIGREGVADEVYYLAPLRYSPGWKPFDKLRAYT